MSGVFYLEDFAIGQVFNTGRLRLDADQIKAFAKQFDPQPFHLDEEAAQNSSSAAWRQAVGTPPRSPCGLWLTASSNRPAASSARLR